MHTRSSKILLEGKTVGFETHEVIITLDDATTITKTVKCVDDKFQLEVTLGAGKTTVSVTGKANASQLIETGFHVYRDCTVTNIIGEKEAYVNTDKIELNSHIVTEGNRTMVPLKEFSGFFGAGISWNQAKRQVTVTLGRRVSTVTIGSRSATVYGSFVDSNPPAKIINGIMYVSSRLFSKIVGGGVAWDSYSRTLTIGVP